MTINVQIYIRYLTLYTHFKYFKEIGHHLLDIVNEIIPFVLTEDTRSKKVNQMKVAEMKH